MTQASQGFSIRLHRGTAAAWTASGIVLGPGEPGYELDTGKMKIGDGLHAWANLPYFSNNSGGGDDDGTAHQELEDHINSDTPHPVYDDGPSLALLYQNAKV